MKIPEKLTVGAIDYDVKIVDYISDSGDGTTGRIDPRLQEILVLRSTNEQAMQQTFLHEFMHALHYHTGDNRGVCAPEERYVDAMAYTLLMVVKDNPGLFGNELDITETTIYTAEGSYQERMVVIDGVEYTSEVSNA